MTQRSDPRRYYVDHAEAVRSNSNRYYAKHAVEIAARRAKKRQREKRSKP